MQNYDNKHIQIINKLKDELNAIKVQYTKDQDILFFWYRLHVERSKTTTTKEIIPMKQEDSKSHLERFVYNAWLADIYLEKEAEPRAVAYNRLKEKCIQFKMNGYELGSYTSEISKVFEIANKIYHETELMKAEVV